MTRAEENCLRGELGLFATRRDGVAHKLSRTAVLALAIVLVSIVAAFFPWMVGGSKVLVEVAAPRGRPGGNPYVYGATIAISLAAAGPVLAAARWCASRRLKRQPSPYRSLRSAIASSFLYHTPTAASLALVLTICLLVTDIGGLVRSHNLPPVGRVTQLIMDEASEGRLAVATAVTASRLVAALFLATLGALIATLALGESAAIRFRAIPWLKALALIPPAILFTFSPYINQLFLWLTPGAASFTNFERVLESWLGRSFLTRVIGQPGHLLFLATVALWPLLIAGLDQYGRWSAYLHDEVRELRLPRRAAILRVMLPNVLLAIAPAYYVAIVLLLVVSYSLEGNGGTCTGLDGVFGLYLHSTQENFRDLLVFGVFLAVLVGIAQLVLFSTIMAFLSGCNPLHTMSSAIPSTYSGKEIQ